MKAEVQLRTIVMDFWTSLEHKLRYKQAIDQPLLAITTGDKITPREIEYEYKLMLEDRKIRVLAYKMVTILAEKLETVISRGDQNTRPRDDYDIYILSKVQGANIDMKTLAGALSATAEKRGCGVDGVVAHIASVTS